MIKLKNNNISAFICLDLSIYMTCMIGNIELLEYLIKYSD